MVVSKLGKALALSVNTTRVNLMTLFLTTLTYISRVLSCIALS